ncbi:MAG TPA: molybdenum cofactor biosynthesis protein MoaE [Gemmatimonadaceae bacterium]
MYTSLVDEPIDVAAMLAKVARHANGATVLFIGTVRDVNDERPVSGMEYTAYRSMAERELADIAHEAHDRFATDDIAIEHRLGTLDLGDASVAIAVAHPHRGAAYDASRYIIEQLKKRVPIWKLEHYVDGTREWVGAGSGKREVGVATLPDAHPAGT